MIAKSKVEEIVNEHLNSEMEFVVDITVSTGNHILVLLDSDSGITIDRCVAISRAIEGSFDREEEDFELEVASAGLSESLRLPRQYKKNLGRSLEVLTNGGQKHHGVLTGVTETSFSIDEERMVIPEGKKRKQKVVEPLTFEYSSVKSVYVMISFR